LYLMEQVLWLQQAPSSNPISNDEQSFLPHTWLTKVSSLFPIIRP
jgi:hypothetical protein